MVALRWRDSRTPSFLAASICSAEEAAQGGDVHHRRIDDLALLQGQALFEQGDVTPSPATYSILTSAALLMVVDFSLP